MSMQQHHEKRRYQRINIRAPVEVTLSGGDIITVTSANLSAGGIAIFYQVQSDPGTRLGLSFTVNADGESRIIRTTGEVVHNLLCGDNGHYIIGMKFLDISDDDQRRIDHYVKSIDRIRS